MKKTVRPRTPAPEQPPLGQNPGSKRSSGVSDHGTVLLAVSGMSPAILTETIWALSHPGAAGQCAVIPDEIVVITTRRGESDLNRALFTPVDGRTVWEQLRGAVLGPAAITDPRLNLREIRVISMADTATGRSVPLDDIRTPGENEAAAEFILDEIRRITANDDTRLVCSLAGGRKTMGALLASALSLLGRAGDRLTHVLVNEPFEDPRLSPKFFFPLPGQEHRLTLAGGEEKTFAAESAVLQLADVPFVPLRYLFRDQLGRFPGGFMSLVKTASNLLRQDAAPLEIALEPETWTATFDGLPVELSGRDIPFFQFLLQRALAGGEPFATHQEAEEPFAAFLAEWAPLHPRVNLEFGGADWRRQPPVAEDFRKRLNSLRDRLRRAGLGHVVPSLLPPHGPLGFPPSRLVRSPADGSPG